jgi:hypothetical protein
MKTSGAIAIVTGVSIFLSFLATAQEKKIKRSDLPLVVERAVVRESQGATIRGLSQEKENGQVLYEAELTVNGRTKDVVLDETGAVVEIDEQQSWDSLSTAVRDGLQAWAGKAKIVKVESVTKKGKLVAYEAQVVNGGKKSEVQVGPDGRPLDHEE